MHVAIAETKDFSNMKKLKTIKFKYITELHEDIYLHPDLCTNCARNSTPNASFELCLSKYEEESEPKIQLYTYLSEEGLNKKYLSDVVEWPSSDMTDDQLENIFTSTKKQHSL